MATSKTRKAQPPVPEKEPIEVVLAANVRAERARNKLGQKELALAVGISHSYVSMIENGSRVPALPLIQKIAEALGVTEARLLTRGP